MMVAPTCDLMSSPMIGRPFSSKHLLDVPLRRLFGADREVADEHVRPGLLEDADDVRGLAGRLLHHVRQVLANSVVRHAAAHLDTQRRDIAELHCVVRAGKDRLRKVEPYFRLVDVERRDELDVADVVAAEVDVHETRYRLLRRRIAVVVHALHERRGAVADAHDRDTDLVPLVAVFVAVFRIVALAVFQASTSCRTLPLVLMLSS
jgi:hypothetical protein